ncbi:MAG: XdhC/CoxI family protein [Hyphomicrobium sp.]
MNVEDTIRHSNDPLAFAAHRLARDGQAALATVISTWGSAPVPVGGQMAVAMDGHFEGSVSSGCIEADAVIQALDAMATDTVKVLEFGIDDDVAWRAKLACGGKLVVMVEPLTRERDSLHLSKILTARQTRSPLVVRTHIASGQRMVFDTPFDAPADAAKCLDTGDSSLNGEGIDLSFCHALMPVVHLIVVGATETGQVLAALARLLGWKITIIDPREAFASDHRFSGFDTRIAWPGAALPDLAPDARTAIVALTHSSQIDDETLRVALEAPCFYIGALGSRKSHVARVERLSAAGMTSDNLSRIHAPVGLDIKAKSPAEIAVSILAEIIASKHGG